MKLNFILLILLIVLPVLTSCSPVPEYPVAETVEQLSEGVVDTVSIPTQTVVTDEPSLLAGFSDTGGWIILFEKDMSTENELYLPEGTTNNGEPARKVALYTQDADRNVTARFTLTAPSIMITSVNSRIQGGTFVGDVYVTAEGFRLVDAVIDGDLYFSSQDLFNAFDVTEGEVTGLRAVAVRCH